MAKNNRRIFNQIGRAQVTGLVDKNNNSLLADSESSGIVSFDNVRINGELKVYGNQTTVNSVTLNVADKNIVLAKGAYDSDSYDSVGITVADSDALFERGTSPTLQYNAQRDAWIANRKILVNTNKEAATDSDATVTIGGFSTQLAANTKFADLVARADSDTIKVSSLQTFVNKLRIDLDSDTSKLQSLDTTIGSIKAKLDSDSNRLQAISTEFKARLDSDTTRISSINRQLNINTANIQSITLDSDGVVNMFNEHSLINITADSDILKPLFRKVMNDFTIRDVGNNIVFSFFDET